MAQPTARSPTPLALLVAHAWWSGTCGVEGACTVTTSDVSVIVPTFNRAALLGQTIDSLLRQTTPARQIIVVDDGSTDETAAVVSRYRGSVQYIYRPNGGKPAALNTGLTHVTGEYTWILDDDDVACPDALERLAAALDQNLDCGFSYGTAYITAPTPIESLEMGQVVGESRAPDTEQTGFLVALLEGNFLGGARILVRTSCYHQLGGYDERFLRSEDYAMPIRLGRRWPAARVSGGPLFLIRNHSGMRGTASDRFDPSDDLAKFYHYDALLFDELFDSMTLDEFIPPGQDPDVEYRQAHLQRFSLSVIHRVHTRLSEMIDVLGQCDGAPYNDAERAVIDRLVARIPGLWTPPSLNLVEQIRRRAATPGVSRLRHELARAALRRRLTPPISPRALVGTSRRTVRMYSRYAP
ncbi:MAG: glycosyltransferase family 2 protein [Rhodococcus sp.]|nr:glycosyltransferase family 2 protein [Rhodococcus sp. (in: high G+C Gram-positive bacteria)]